MAQPPRSNPNIDLKTLPLRPEEAFVYSRADGYTLPRDIAFSTGLTLDEVEKALRRLGQLGALDGVEPEIEAKGDSSAAASATDEGFVPVPDLDITTDEQRRVWRLWSRLDQYNYYQLLGISRRATREQVKAAYFDRVAAFHPDKHFKKVLGTYKEKFETVFQRLTLAHDTLSRTLRREQYDATLPLDAPDGAPELSERPSSRNGEKPLDHAQSRVPTSDSVPDAPTARLSQDPAATASGDDVAAPLRDGTCVAPSVSGDARRQLARRAVERGLRRGPSGEFPFPKPSTPPPSSTNGSPPSSRLAAIERARTAENNADWQMAGTIYEQLARSAREAPLFSKAADCMERAARATGEDPSPLWRRAVESARQAVQISPRDIHLKLQLSRLYAGAGKSVSALREAERAQELSPSDKSVQSWLERLRRGDV